MLHMHKRWFEMHVPRLVKKGFFFGWVEKASQWPWNECCFKIIDEKGQASNYSVSILPFYSRDLWDSEQLSQIAGSQGSQNSSSDMFSQSRMSQLKGLSSFDVWSQPSNSQQLVEVFFSLFERLQIDYLQLCCNPSFELMGMTSFENNINKYLGYELPKTWFL